MPQDNRFHSEEAQEILGKIPPWIVRYGISTIFTIFVGIVVACYFIKYPETIIAPIEITTENAPIDVYSRDNGLLSVITVKNNQIVEHGELLAIINNSADYNSINLIDENLSKSVEIPFDKLILQSWIYKEYCVGDIQNPFSIFRQECQKYAQYLTVGFIPKKKELVVEQIVQNEKYFMQLSSQNEILATDIKYEINSFNRDSILFVQKLISQQEYENAIRSLLSKRNNKIAFEAQITNTELNIIQLEQQLIELSMQLNDEIAKYNQSISLSRQQLLAQIDTWKLRYVITAPTSGKISFLTQWDTNQHINTVDKFVTVIPIGENKIVGRMNIPQTGFGKVKDGQLVNIKLNGFPYMEFGVLKGKISYISSVPNKETGYVAEVIFENGLISSYNKTLPLIQQMNGTAEIITKDKRLIMRFIDPIVALFDSGL